jgi:hypothetical protein
MLSEPDRVFEMIVDKAVHEPARVGLGVSHALARCKSARLGLARFADEPEK